MRIQHLSTILAAGCLLTNTGCKSTPASNQRAAQPTAYTEVGPTTQKKAHLTETKGAECLLTLKATPPALPELPSEMNIPKLRRLADAWFSLPRTTNFVTTWQNGVPARVAICEVGNATNSRVLVCIHGFFGTHRDWRYIAAALGHGYRLWLIDLPGSGASDPPGLHTPGHEAFHPTAMADRVCQVLESQLAVHPEVSRLVLCGTSYGGMLALRMLSDEGLRQRYGPTLTAVEGLVLFAPADVVITQATETWNSVLALNAAKVWAGRTTGILPSMLRNSIRSGFCDPSLASGELLNQGQFVLQNGDCRRSTQDLLRYALPWRVWGKRPDWSARHAIEAAYQNIQVPCLIVWGDCDETLSIAMGYKLKDQIPDARLVVVPDAMHLLALEKPRTCAALLREFVTHLKDPGLSDAHSVQTLDPGIEEAIRALSEGVEKSNAVADD